MQISNSGHVVNSNGKSTNPTASIYFAGTASLRIAIDVLTLDDGRVAIHSMYGNLLEKVAEDFLYEIVEPEEALKCLETMIDDAHDFLIEKTGEDVESSLHSLIEDFKNNTVH